MSLVRRSKEYENIKRAERIAILTSLACQSLMVGVYWLTMFRQMRDETLRVAFRDVVGYGLFGLAMSLPIGGVSTLISQKLFCRSSTSVLMMSIVFTLLIEFALAGWLIVFAS